MTQSQVLNANFDWLQAGKKEFFPEYKIDNQKTVFDRITKAKRSTFDLSKFTVVGSPTITNGGIASGVDKRNFIQEVVGFSANYSTLNYEIHHRILIKDGKFDNESTNLLTLPLLITSHKETSAFSAYIYTSEHIKLNIQGLGFNYSNICSVNNNIEFIDLIIKNNGTAIIIETYDQNKNLLNRIENKTTASNFPIYNAIISLNTNTSDAFNTAIPTYSYDLKRTSIIIDGIEVFNGNKTGIDQIKKDDFAVVGNPVISNDGIASGFSDSHYIRYNAGITTFNKLEILTPIIVTDSIDADNYVFMGTGISNNVGILTISTQNIYFYWNEDNTSKYIVFVNAIATPNTKYQFKITLEQGVAKLYRSVNGNDFTLYGTPQNIPFSTISLQGLIGRHSVGGHVFTGSIDLNSFKIYVDGNLVYQPTLRIPYTQSKIGSKIVDSVYRDRVQDMYEQFGYTHYFTLGENDYTMQTVPNEKIVDSYYADNSFMELTADLSLTQGGGAMSSQTVNLKRSYKDNKYIVTIGTSSKDTNSFVASATGQWITKGKGVLG